MDQKELREFKSKLRAKIKKQGMTFSSFWENHIHLECDILYNTFMNQLDGRGTLQPCAEDAINKFLKPPVESQDHGAE